MATTNKSLIQQTYNTGTGNLPANQIVDPAWIATPYTNWSVPVNYDFGAIDLALGGSVTISVTSVVVSPQAMVLSQYQPMSIIFTGVLSANLTYALPSSVGGTWAVYNNTTGAFTLSMSTPAGTSLSVVIPSGGPNFVVCNSTTGISIYQSSVPDGSITSAKLASTTGSGSVVLAGSPTLSGAPLSTTAAVDTNTTQIATTAYVVNQGYLKSATASSTYAPLASPALTGAPTAPTAGGGTNNTQIATTAFVQSAVSGLIVGGFVFLGTASTTSGTSSSISVSLGTYSFISVIYSGVSTTNSGTGTVQINGVTLATMASPGSSCSGTAYIELLQGYCTFSVQSVGSSQINVGTATGVTSGTTTITFTPLAGSFDAGSISVYGVK